MTRFAADALLVLHFAWVLFMVAGFPLAWALRSRALRLVHALGLGSYLALAVLGRLCPLTEWESALRQAADPAFSYHGSFLATWVERVIYVESWGAPLWIFRVLAALYLLGIVSSWWWWRPAGRRDAERSSTGRPGRRSSRS
jgi:hypothetical protein